MADTRLSRRDAAALERLRIERRYNAIVRLGSLLVGRGFKWGFWAFLAYQARQAVAALAGKTTLANIAVALGAKVSVMLAVSWAASVGFGIWVFFERRLRKGTIERLTLRNKDLELQLDRRRSSSELTPRGETRPDDQL
jgi:hypothetical protein